MKYLTDHDEKIIPTVVSLNTLLADYHIYYQNLRNFHWNIMGKNFFDLHPKFEQLYSEARLKIDEIAERILTLNYHPVSRYSEYLNISSLQEVKSLIEAKEMVKTTIENQVQIIKQMKEVIEEANKASDEGTVDLMSGYIRQLEKETWMLNAWTKAPNEKLQNATMSEAF